MILRTDTFGKMSRKGRSLVLGGFESKGPCVFIKAIPAPRGEALHPVATNAKLVSSCDGMSIPLRRASLRWGAFAPSIHVLWARGDGNPIYAVLQNTAVGVV